MARQLTQKARVRAGLKQKNEPRRTYMSQETGSKGVAQVLREARALIDTPEKWCQGTYTRIADDGTENGVLQRCAVESVWAAMGGTENGASVVDVDPAIKALTTQCGGAYLFMWQDALPYNAKGHAKLMKLFDRAIAAEEVA